MAEQKTLLRTTITATTTTTTTSTTTEIENKLPLMPRASGSGIKSVLTQLRLL